MSDLRLYCMDAPIWFFRALYSWPDRWQSADGLGLNGVMGFAATLKELLVSEKPGHLMAAFDESLFSGWRHDLCPDYKANRVLPDDNIAFQLACCKALATELGVPVYADKHYEADDFIGRAAHLARAQGGSVTVMTRDKDLGQVLQSVADEWWDVASGKRLNKAAWEAANGFRAEQLPEFLALTGDSSDNIAGVPGIGPKTAKALLAQWDLDTLLDRPDLVRDSGLRGAAGIADKLAQHREVCCLARQLASLNDAMPEPRRLSDLEFTAPRWVQAAAYLRAAGVPEQWVRRWAGDTA